ncbi:barstar family protein [Streptomyces sp. NPDC058371]|uniref:barstar family protein n=1 Tax=Streptomyces sp. NPDC058371 TaxID=3346463 RepID=UPI0036650E66
MRPPKYALVAYAREAAFNDALEHPDTWALCTDTEDLCADPPPPARGTYALLGCEPEGGLCIALTRARSDGSAPLGRLGLEILDKWGRQSGDWFLEDVRVLGDLPCARDLSLRDVTIEASESVHNLSDHPQRPPHSPGYRIRGATGEHLGGCKDMAHVRAEPSDLTEPPLRLLGCSPRGALRAALDTGEEDLGHATLLRLDARGRAVQPAVEGELTAWIPSARGRGLIDLTLEPWSERPPTAAPEVWDLWWEGRPTEPNLWARCGAEARGFWLRTAQANRTYDGPDAPPGATHHLDGRHITDEPGFFCALGEAVNGPGGYFGQDLATLTECLRGGWGAEGRFTLVWHDAEVARTCLGVTPHTGSRPSTFEELLAFFAGTTVDVRLARGFSTGR